jgi:hypothetical protein
MADNHKGIYFPKTLIGDQRFNKLEAKIDALMQKG